ncbi:MAG TPA: hypothetical protein PKZ00_11530, partial [Elusimicrobiota bacterium]|nr:hypothetical protein [Elusimicrobiota bacterium]
AWGELDPGLLKVFPDRELRDRAAEEFLRVGWLTGEEHLAVTADDLALRLVGVDDPLLHRANRAARDRAEPLAGLAHRRLARLADRAVRRQAALWPQSLRDLEAIRRRYEADEESLAHYVRALVSRLPPGERSGYPALDAFGRLSLLEDRYEPDRARQDLRDLAARSSALAPADRAALRAGLRAGPRERSRALLELIRRVAGTGSAQWPALRAHAEALALRAAIDAGRLASEVESAHRRVVDDLLRQRPESQRSDLLGLLAATDWIHSRQRLWSFEMTPREWRAARRDWARYGWADVETLLGDAAPAESGDAVRAALRDAEDHLRDFYETALQRNRAMADNTLAAARRWRADRVVLITGG